MKVSALVGFSVALSITLIAIPIAIRLGFRLGALDQPGEKKIHRSPTPYFGGLAILAGFGVAIVIASTSDQLRSPHLSHLIAFSVAAIIIVGIGLIDDMRGLSAIPKLVGQAIAASGMVVAGLTIDSLQNPLGNPIELGILAPIVTILWLVTVMNAFNMVDGIDGLAGGLGLVSAIGILGLGLRVGDSFAVVLAAALAGALAGFLLSNFHPARIFMGDAGSTLIGLTLGSAGISLANAGRPAIGLLPVVMIIGVPLIDLVSSVLRRAINGQNPLRGDQDHLHHLLLGRGIGQRAVVAYLIALATVLAATGALLAIHGEWKTLRLLEIAALPVLVIGLVFWQIRRPRENRLATDQLP